MKTRDGQDLVPRIVADLLPAADAVEPFVDLGQEAGDLARVVLQVGVERDDQVAAGGVEAGREGGRLAEIAAEADAADARIGRRELLDSLPRAVGRAVVDEDDFQVVAVACGHVGQLARGARRGFRLRSRRG